MQQLFDGIFSDGKGIYTKNLLPGKRVYGEKLVQEKGTEFREWNPYRSKYCAAIKKGLKQSIFSKGAKILYLGSAEGTTISHVSDIVGKEGEIYGVDLSEIAMMKLMKLSEARENIYPILADANNTKDYTEFLEEKVDAMFQDISQRNQAEIFLKNACFLKKRGLGALSLKTKSVAQEKQKEEVLAQEKKILEKEFEVLQVINLEPYEKEHYLILMRKK